MYEKNYFGAAIEHLLRRKAMSRADLADAAEIKKETLDRVIQGRTKPRARTREAIILDGFCVSLEFFARIENAILKGENPSDIHFEHHDRESLALILPKLLEGISGLPLPVARSIMIAFGERGDTRSPGEIEEILRRKAIEYQELKKQIQHLSGSDPKVLVLRDKSLKHIEEGRFDEASSLLQLAQSIDRSARLAIERSAESRRLSETHTLLSRAKLSGLMFNYASAANQCQEAISILIGFNQELENALILECVRYLSLDANETGNTGSEKRNIEIIENFILPRLNDSDRFLEIEVRYTLADIYSLLGYKSSNNVLLLRAAKKFKENVALLPESEIGEFRLLNLTRLGDTHAEIGLNRNSQRQASLGVRIMRCALNDAKTIALPATRARCLIRLGTALANAGLLYNRPNEYEEAAAAYQEAVDLISAECDPLNRARAFWGLAIAFAGEGERRGSIDLLARSQAACDEAMQYISRDRFPVDWATLMHNRGNAKLKRGKLENGVETLHDAIRDYQSALSIRTATRFKLGFIKSAGNKASAERVLAERTDDLAYASKAKKALTNVIYLTHVNHSFWKKYYKDELDIVNELIERLKNH